MINKINKIVIDELEVKKLDNKFGTKSRVFLPDIIIVETPLDQWKIQVTDKQYKGICLQHMNKRNKKNKYHIQGWKNSIFDTYDSIFTHKNWMSVIKTSNTYGVNHK